METQPSFNLTAAIETWRHELAKQTTLTEEVRRELETHLSDTVAEMQKRGLNDEESFWLARRRVGKPNEIDEEFVKAKPVNIWRERVFWIVFGLLAINMWSISLRYLWNLIAPSPFLYTGPEHIHLIIIRQYGQYLLSCVSLVLIAVLVAQGRLTVHLAGLNRFLRSRKTFILVSGSVFLTIQCADFALEAVRAKQGGWSTRYLYSLFYLNPLILITLAAWLLPSAERERPDVSESSGCSST